MSYLKNYKGWNKIYEADTNILAYPTDEDLYFSTIEAIYSKIKNHVTDKINKGYFGKEKEEFLEHVNSLFYFIRHRDEARAFMNICVDIYAKYYAPSEILGLADIIKLVINDNIDENSSAILLHSGNLFQKGAKLKSKDYYKNVGNINTEMSNSDDVITIRGVGSFGNLFIFRREEDYRAIPTILKRDTDIALSDIGLGELI